MKNTNNSVKKRQTYWVLLLAVLFSGTLSAKVNSYLGAYDNVGEWSMLPSESKYGPSIGVAGGAGFLFEMQAGGTYSPTRFVLDIGVGAHGGFTSYMQSNSMAPVVLEKQHDLDGALFDYVYDIQERKDQYTNLAVQIPLMIGVQHKKFYMLAGVKIDANLLTRSHSSAKLNTYGVYNEFDEFRNMPEYQFFTDKPISTSVKTQLRLNVNASLEIGGRLGFITDAVGYDVPKRKMEMRLGGFIDYGLVDLHSPRSLLPLGLINPADPNGELVELSTQYIEYNNGYTIPIYKNTTMVDKLVMNDIMSTSDFAKIVRNLCVGLKFTILFQMPEQGKCVICHDAYNSSVKSGRSGRGVKYEE